MIMIIYDYSKSVINHRRLVIFKRIFLNEIPWASINISLKFVRYAPINNKSELAEVLAWCWTDDTPLTGPMMTQFDDTYMRHPT